MSEKLPYQLKYLVIPDTLYKDNRLSLLQLKLICFIFSFKGDKFFFSNEHLGEMFDSHPNSISRAISGLEELKYIKLEYEIKATGGKLRFIRLNTPVNSDLTSQLSQTKQPCEDNGNKLNDNKLNVLSKDNTASSGQVLLAGRKARKQSNGYGNPDINELINYLQQKLDLPVLDGTQKDNRRYAYLALKKFGGLVKCKLIIDAALRDSFWKTKVTSVSKLYYKGVEIANALRNPAGQTIVIQE